MFVDFPNHFTAEPAEDAENSPYFLCEIGDPCGEGNMPPSFYPLPSYDHLRRMKVLSHVCLPVLAARPEWHTVLRRVQGSAGSP